MHEPYRTLLGHFRHEVGHYYWDRLVRDGDKLEPIRQVFGDERIDYEQALNGITPTAPRRIGRQVLSAATRPHIRGKISPRPGHTTFTLSIRWRWRPHSALLSIPLWQKAAT